MNMKKEGEKNGCSKIVEKINALRLSVSRSYTHAKFVFLSCYLFFFGSTCFDSTAACRHWVKRKVLTSIEI